jgi:hypothetical protein
MGPSFILTLADVPGTTTKRISWYNAQFYGIFAVSANFY